MAGRQATSLTVDGHADVFRGARNASASVLPSRTRPLPGAALCMALVACAMILGGGGTTNPQTEMVLQVLTAAVMIPLVASPSWQHGLGQVHGAAWLLAGLVLLLPSLQLIPLPPAIWQALPGRDIEVRSLALANAQQSWMPLSMAPARTFASLLAIICPVLLMLQVSRLSLRGRNWLCTTIVAVAGLSVLLGVLQLSHTGGLDWSLYSQFSKGFLVGFQANRNAQADILLIALLALGVVVATRLADGKSHLFTWFGFWMGLLVFLVGVFMTGSRTGISLLLLTLAFLAVMLWPSLSSRRHAAKWMGGLLAVLAAAAVLLSQLTSVQKVLGRFSISREARWDLWADTWFAIQQVWPFGSGIGTIVPMLEAAERLDVVDSTAPVRAHNDWLEWVLEGGLPGIVILGLIILVVVMLAVRALLAVNRSRPAPARRAQVVFACGVMLIEALHAIVDYPLRSMSLATLTAVAAAFLLDAVPVQQDKP